MDFNLEGLFNNSADFVKYSMAPYPPYFQQYDWIIAEEDADNNIKDERFFINSPDKGADNSSPSHNLMIQSKKTERYNNDFVNLPENVRERLINKVLPRLLTDPKNPKIKAKKVKNTEIRWAIKIDLYYSFTFDVANNSIVLRCVGPVNRA